MIRQTAEMLYRVQQLVESSAAVHQIRQVLEELNAIIADLQSEIRTFRI